MDINVKIATAIIEEVRQALAEKRSPEEIEKYMESLFGIKPIERCIGEAHQPGVDYDHCGCCMGHSWGWQGMKITVRARMPKPKADPPFDASRD